MTPGRWSDGLRYRLLVALTVVGAAALLYLHWRDTQTRDATEAASIRTPQPRAGEWVRHGDAHEVIDARRCVAPGGGEVELAQPIHRWVDQRGVVHFSDRPPGEGEARVHALRETRAGPAVRVSIETPDAVLPHEAIAAATADAISIGRVLEQVMGVPTGGGVSLNIVLAGSDAAFRAAAPDARSNFAVYLGDRHIIVLRTHDSHEITLDVLRHEITHALLHEWVGPLPTALEEGLADYFESFRGEGAGGVVDPSRYAAQLSGDPPPDDDGETLRKLLAMSSIEFHAEGRARHYTWSLGLVSALMATPDRRHSLAAVMRTQRLQPCSGVDARALLGRAWHGGLIDLAAAWRDAHLDEQQEPHRY
jgi:hypothetical protein